MKFLSFASSAQPIKIPLNNVAEETNLTVDSLEQTQYITSVIIINQDIVCAISQQSLKFYSIQPSSTKQGSLIGEILAQSQIKTEFELFYHKLTTTDEQYISKDEIIQRGSNFIEKFQNFTKPTIIQHKGVVYDSTNQIFFILVSSETNKYLVKFKINFNESKVEIKNFQVIYNFSNPKTPAKYNLQMDPELLYLQKSQILVLIRKFYSDSLVIVFKTQQEINSTQRQTFKQELESFNRTFSNSSSEEGYQGLIQKREMKSKIEKQKMTQNSQANIVCRHSRFWEFYINQECLSVLENIDTLVNFRQVISKLQLELDFLDIFSKQKFSVIIKDNIIAPMTLKHVQLLSALNNEQLKMEKGALFWHRFFGVLKNRQATCIFDYDSNHDKVINYWIMEGIFIETISQFHTNQEYSFVNFIYRNKNYIGVMSNKIPKQIEGKDQISQKFFQQLIDTAVQINMDRFAWDINLRMAIQYTISVKNQSIELKKSQLIGKTINYIHILDQISQKSDQKDELLQSNQFTTCVFDLLSFQ